MNTILRYALVPVFITAIISGFVSCAQTDAPAENKNDAVPKLTEFEREIRSLKTAGFDYIFVFKRRDGGKLTADDKQFLRQKSHNANRRSLSTDGTALFVGTNFEFEEGDLEELKEIFAFEDYSKPAEQIKKKKEERRGGGNGSGTGSDKPGNRNSE